MADKPVLVFRSGPLAGQVVEVAEGETSIGRAADSGIVIDDADVSRFHGTLRYDNGSLWLRDEGSRNGIEVNGKRLVDHRALKVGDVVTIASSEIEVTWQDLAATPPPKNEDEEASTASGMWRRLFGR